MRTKKTLLVMFLFLTLICSSVYSQILVNPELLNRVKSNINSVEYKDIIKKLKREVDKILDMKPPSVVDKTQVPPNGNKHDYFSLAPYWWPDPKKPNGLPYIRKDGEINPERDKIPDKENLTKLINSVFRLSIAYYLIGDESYAKKAIELLRVWFLDENTKMNPNLNYAQAIPGRNEGRGAGIIDAHRIYLLIDAIHLLKNSKNYSDVEFDKLKIWFSEYLNWLMESNNGKDESEALNNHGTWYHVQVASIALLLNNREVLTKALENVRELIPIQIEPDGMQPKELIRTKSLHYCFFNLEAHFIAALIAERINIDLWNYKTDDGRSMQKAFDYLLPFAFEEKEWQYQQIEDFQYDKIYPLMLLASKKYNESKYSVYIKKYFKHKTQTDIMNLLIN